MMIDWGRVAQASDFAGITNTAGAPSFAQFAKGGNHERMRNRVCAEGTTACVGSIVPALAKNAKSPP